MSIAVRASSAFSGLRSNNITGNVDNTMSYETPKVKYNEDLNGYHFHFFVGRFISREELPRGSETFQQVLDEINEELGDIQISEKPKVLSVNNRRKSVATMQQTSAGRNQCHANNNTNNVKSEKRRKISWGKPVVFNSETPMTSYSRPRVCSDGAVVRRSSLRPR